MADYAESTQKGTSHADRVATLFFLSGFPALIYQIVWQIALFRIFGVNIESVTIVVAAFMVGLGLGGLSGGQLSRRKGISPLLLLASIEIATGLFGLASLTLFDLAGAHTLGTSLPITATTALLLVLVPTLLMGATLPVLVTELVRRDHRVGNAVGLLYSVNTMGAGTAALLVTPVLLAFFGMQVTVWIAVAMNFTVAAGALLIRSRSRPAPALPDPVAERATSALPLSFTAMLALGFMSGFVSLSYEIFLYRVYSLATGGMAWSFPVMLGLFLFGVAGGALLVSRWLSTDEGRSIAFRRTAWMLLAANAIGLLMLPLLSLTSPLGQVPGFEIPFVVAIAALWGGVLPLLAESGIVADTSTGARVGALYLANIAGSLAGTLGTGFVLMDHLGMRELAELLALLGLLGTVVFAFSLPLTRWVRQALLVATVLLLVSIPLHHRMTSNIASAIVLHTPDEAPRHVVENKSGVIVVDRDGVVYGHGSYDGSLNTDIFNPRNIIVRPYFLSLFHPHPQRVLMIGLSAGSWAQVIANNPSVEHLTIVEINEGYREVVAAEPSSRSLLANPKVTLIRDDGRRWLRLNPDQRFDVVMQNTMVHFRANATNLLSREFLELLKAHLEPDGVVYYNTTGSVRAQLTGCNTFAHGFLQSSFIVLSDAPLRGDVDRWERTLRNMRIDGRPVVGPGQERQLLELLSLYRPDSWVDCASLREKYAGAAPITDDNRGAEWSSLFGIY